MRIRALLFIPALAAAVLGIGASGASAATLFTTTGHTARVTVGAAVTATAETPIDLTLPTGTLANRCTASTLHAVVEENSMTHVSLRVTAGSFSTCNAAVTPTLPWTVTVTGNGTVSAPNTVYAAAVDNVAFDIAGIPGSFAGSLSTGVTFSQPTVGTSPITINLNDACGAVSSAGLGTGCIDGRYIVDAPWSLTN